MLAIAVLESGLNFIELSVTAFHLNAFDPAGRHLAHGTADGAPEEAD